MALVRVTGASMYAKTMFATRGDERITSLGIGAAIFILNCEMTAIGIAKLILVLLLSYGRVFCLESQKIDGTEYLMYF